MDSLHRNKRPLDAQFPNSTKRQRQEGAGCATEDPHVCERSAPGQKKKYYAVWGGPNPGVHFTDWQAARRWIEGFPVKQRSFKGDGDEALRWYREQKQKHPGLSLSKGSDRENPPVIQPSTCGPTAPGSDRDLQASSSHLTSLTQGRPAHSPFVPSHQLQPTPFSQEPPLSDEQNELVELIVGERKNVFYTGSAGVGKSRVLKVFRRRLVALGYKVNVVAPTGRAALDVNGSTTWSYAGWTPDSMRKPLKDLIAQAWSRTTKRRLRQTDVLVIDEISMVENLHLERLNLIMKEVRTDPRPFGGVQVIVTGDFCQLPPVQPFSTCITCGKPLVPKARKSAHECVECNRIYDDEDKWAFKSKAWQEANFVHVNLETVYRQRDRAFVDILQKLRLGKPLTPEDRLLLCQEKESIDKAVKLYPRKVDVKRINDAEFKKLATEAALYRSIDNFDRRNHHHNLESYNRKAVDGTLSKLAEHRYEPHLELKKGMLVVLLANISISDGLVNGSQGVIVGFSDFWNEEDKQKSDEEKQIDIELVLEGDYKPYRAARIFEFMTAAQRKEWPIVRFVHKGRTMDIIVEASCYPTEVGDEPAVNPRYSLLSRTQIPLMAAWAMTIHKSQGMTLEKVEVDLSRNFEEGMAYVALSRATSLEGLRVIAFPENAEMGANEEVRGFLREKFNIE